MHIESTRQLLDGAESRIYLIVLDTNQAAQGHASTLGELRLCQ
jgi:hypothetical protein